MTPCALCVQKGFMQLPVTNSINLKTKAQGESEGIEGTLSKNGKGANSVGKGNGQADFLNILQGLQENKNGSLGKKLGEEIEGKNSLELLGTKEGDQSLGQGLKLNQKLNSNEITNLKQAPNLNQDLILGHDGIPIVKRDKTFQSSGEISESKLKSKKGHSIFLQNPIEDTIGKKGLKSKENKSISRKSFFVGNKKVEVPQINANSLKESNLAKSLKPASKNKTAASANGIKRNPFFVNKKGQLENKATQLDTDFERNMILSGKGKKNLGSQKVAQFYSSHNEPASARFNTPSDFNLNTAAVQSNLVGESMVSKGEKKENGKLIDILTKKEILSQDGFLPIQNNLKIGEKVEVGQLIKPESFNMNSLGTNREGIISQISDYVSQMNVQNRSSLSLKVNHNSLGTFSIKANKSNKNGNIDIQILTKSDEANQFFKQNEGEILKSLNQNGLKVVDVKVFSTSTDSQLSLNKDGSTSFEDNGFLRDENQGQRHGRNQDDRDSQRRKELWEEYKEKLGA